MSNVNLPSGKTIVLGPDDLWVPSESKPLTLDQVLEAKRMLMGESNTPVKKEDKCYHDWVTQTMFRFDMTYCKKCGQEKK